MWSNIFTGSGGVRTCMSLDGWGHYSACSRGRWIPRGSLAKGSSGEAREVLRDVTVSSPSGLVNAHWEDTNTSGWWWRGYTSIQPILCFCSFFVFFFNWNKCCNSVAKLCPILCNPVDCSTPDSSVLHLLPELAQTHVHWVGDAIQPSHPLPSPSAPALSLSQHQGLFQWVGSSHQVAKVLALQLQHQSFQWTFRTDFL